MVDLPGTPESYWIISRQVIRHNMLLYLGAFVALCVGVFLLGLAAMTTAATVAYAGSHSTQGIVVSVTGGGEPPHDVTVRDESDVGGLQAVLSLVTGISGFITICVVASTFAFIVGSRRREIGLLRLIGATPRQMRWMVRGEALVVAIGIVVAMLGAFTASRRAARVTPMEALRGASIERRGVGVVRFLIGVSGIGGGVVLVTLIQPDIGDLVVLLGMGVPMVLVIGLLALGTPCHPSAGAVLGYAGAAQLRGPRRGSQRRRQPAAGSLADGSAARDISLSGIDVDDL